MLDRNSIKQTLIELMEADTGETYANFEETSNLRTDLGLDSVDLVSIVSQVERRFRLRLSQQDLEKLVTLTDLLDLLEMKTKEATASQSTAA
jgi:acyl carrier protein